MLIFSERLRATRKAHNLSLKEMAAFLGVSLRAYQYYEEGKREPTYDNLAALAKHLNVSTDYLLGLKDEM